MNEYKITLLEPVRYGCNFHFENIQCRTLSEAKRRAREKNPGCRIEAVEVWRQLKDYRGFQVWKQTEQAGTVAAESCYWLQDQNDNNIDIFESMEALKKYVGR